PGTLTSRRPEVRASAMDQGDWLAERFEEHRARLRAVAYRMLGSLSEADDAVQDAWLRLARADSGAIDDIGAWLTTVVARVCLDEIAPLMDRTPAATRQLVSRARRRVRAAPVPDTEPAGQRRVVDAFFKAVTDGDMEALLAVLDPDVVVRADFGASAHARMPR